MNLDLKNKILKKITIAIDGHSSTGKSTLAKELAKKLGYIYVDSGAMYRCVALYAMQNNFFKPELQEQLLVSHLNHIDITFKNNAASKSNHTYLNGVDVEDKIRKMDVSNLVSGVAKISEVRAHLVRIQKNMGLNKGVVMDGRDIGTVVFPDAELKIFMTASAEVRAQRRFDELSKKGQNVTFEGVLENLQKRDNDDSNRSDSPLVVAENAKVLDNSTIDRETQFKLALQWAKDAIENKN